MTELLAPAGSIEGFYAAINGGCDAVYLGLDLFSARKNAQNFTMDNLPFFIDYAHILGVKVYVALNTLVKDRELEDFLRYAQFCNDNNVDACLLQDMFLGGFLHQRFPSLTLHLSTQAGVNNLEGALLAKEYGFTRVVLARETPFSEVKKIAEVMETEVFVQGALCTAFSGQCYMSSFAGNNSGNRGLCKQPCRKLYTLKNSKTANSGYCISLSDLCLAPKLKDLIDIGVCSLKIEGRMRKPSYVYYATKYYRDLLSGKNPSISPLKRTFNRGNYTLGLMFCQDKNLISDKIQNHMGEAVGTILSVKNDKIKVKSDHVFTYKTSGKILRDGLEVGNYFVDENNNLRFSQSAAAGDMVTITTDSALEEKPVGKRLKLLEVNARFCADSKAQIEGKTDNTTFMFYSDFTLQKAVNAPLTQADLSENLLKCGDYPFLVTVNVQCDNVFIPKSQLNKLRRDFYDGLVKNLTKSPYKPVINNNFVKPIINDSKSLLIIDNDFSQILDADFDIGVYSPDDYGDISKAKSTFEAFKVRQKTLLLYLPPLLNEADKRLIDRLLSYCDGLYTDGYYGIKYAKEVFKPCFLGTGVNIYNSVSAGIAQNTTLLYAVSKEATINEAKKLGGYYYSAGSLKVMDLAYCPFKKQCNNCLAEQCSVLDDGIRQFNLRRIKLSDCRFEVYNAYPLLTEGLTKQIFNFINLTFKQKSALLENALCPSEAKREFTSYTQGHSKKSLL